MPNYWALAANPKDYRIEDAISNLDIDFWTTAGSKIQIGDSVLIWKTIGGSKKRGIVALGEVISNPQMMSDEQNPYWNN